MANHFLTRLTSRLLTGVAVSLVLYAGGTRPNPIVIAAATPARTASGGHGGAAADVGGASAPAVDYNRDVVKPIKSPSTVYFNVSADPHKVKAGATAMVTVTLKLNDQPFKGAAVEMAMLFTPGSDYRFAPSFGVTDENGVFTSTVTTSKNPGESVLAATSGAFSDQDHVLGTAPNGKVASASRAAPPPTSRGFAPLLVLGLLAIGLVAGGVYLNVRPKLG